METFDTLPIPSADAQGGPLREQLRETNKKIAELEKRVTYLQGVCETLRAVIRQQGVSDDTFIAISEDLKTKKPEALACRNCGKTLQRGIGRCIYCGSVHGEVF